MDKQIEDLIERAETCSRKTGKSLSRIATLAGTNPSFFASLKEGRTCTVRVLNQIVAKIEELEADHVSER